MDVSAGIQASLAGRYASALFELASEAGTVTAVWDSNGTRAEMPTVLAAVRDVVGTGAAGAVPVVAAGGVGTAEDVRALLTAGADVVAAGTAFLLTPEAGTSAAHRAAVAACAAGTRFSADDGRARTALTRAAAMLPESSGWHALARMYLALAEIHN